LVAIFLKIPINQWLVIDGIRTTDLGAVNPIPRGPT